MLYFIDNIVWEGNGQVEMSGVRLIGTEYGSYFGTFIGYKQLHSGYGGFRINKIDTLPNINCSKRDAIIAKMDKIYIDR